MSKSEGKRQRGPGVGREREEGERGERQRPSKQNCTKKT